MLAPPFKAPKPPALSEEFVLGSFGVVERSERGVRGLVGDVVALGAFGDDHFDEDAAPVFSGRKPDGSSAGPWFHFPMSEFTSDRARLRRRRNGELCVQYTKEYKSI